MWAAVAVWRKADLATNGRWLLHWLVQSKKHRSNLWSLPVPKNWRIHLVFFPSNLSCKVISNKNPLGFFTPTLKFTVTKFTLFLLEKLFIAKLYFTASIFEAVVVLQIKAKQKNIWLIFNAKFVRKCSGRDNFFIDYSYWLFHLRYFIVSAKKLCICNYSKTTPPFNLHDLKFICPHLGLQVMTFPKQLLMDDFCWMMNFYLLYSRKSCKNFRNSCNRNFQFCQ